MNADDFLFAKNNMAIPKYEETMYPLLSYIQDGLEYNVRDISDDIRERYFKLTDQEKELKSSNGKTKFHDNLTWGRTYLKKAGLVDDPKRGFVKITERGLDFLKNNKLKSITKNDLVQFESFNDFLNKKNVEINEITSKTEDLSPQELIETGYSELNENLKIELLEKLKKSNPYYFEKIILLLFQSMGYGDFHETKKSGDGGIDGIINQDALGIEKIYTQAKRYTTSNVGERDIRNFKGAMDDGKVSKGIFVTTSGFDNKAKESANKSRNKIVLINGEKLVELMIKYNLGVQVENTYFIKKIDEDFFIEESKKKKN